MKPKAPQDEPEQETEGGKTRPPEAPLDQAVAEAYRQVQPPGFRDHPSSSIEAAVVDSDVDDTIGGE